MIVTFLTILAAFALTYGLLGLALVLLYWVLSFVAGDPKPVHMGKPFRKCLLIIAVSSAWLLAWWLS